MARSNYMYLLRNKDTKEILGGWTVKSEGFYSIADSDMDISNKEFIRVDNGMCRAKDELSLFRYDIALEVQKAKEELQTFRKAYRDRNNV